MSGNNPSDAHDRAEQWLTFVRDFGYLDTTALLERLPTEPHLAGALDAVIMQGRGRSSDILANVRNFCVQALMGTEPSPPVGVSPHLQARVALSPYSVPYALIRETLANWDRRANRKIPWQIKTSMWVKEAGYPYLTLPQHSFCIMTNCRIAETPAESATVDEDTELCVTDRATNRNILTAPLRLLRDADIPIFYPIAATSGTDIEFRLRPGFRQISAIAWGWECRSLL